MKWQFYKPQFEYDLNFPEIDQNSAWVGHKYFAYDFVRNIKPQSIVELGTHYGTSFFSMCQAVKDTKYNSSLFAIDTWQGDKHAGFYSDYVYETVKNVISKCYSKQNVELIRKKFAEAIEYFDNESIDLLHIDGLHTYEAVKNDFSSWIFKVKKNGAIFIHDVMVKEKDFGVYKLWNEIKNNYPSFEFVHSYGLGIIFKKKDNLPEIFKEAYSWTNYAKIYYFNKNLTDSKETKNTTQYRHNLIDTIKKQSKHIEKIENKLFDSEKEKNYLTEHLKKITSSKTYRVWQFYNKFKPNIKFKILSGYPLPTKISKSGDVKENKELPTNSGNEIITLLNSSSKSLSFRVAVKPKISIVIVTFNKWEYTKRCLHSIKQNINSIPYELIIVDNNSTDQTVKELNRIKGIQLIRNQSNCYYYGGCNQGVKQAKGDFVYLLNNDTEINADTIPALLETIQFDKKIAAVGSKIIQPNGTLQEAGSMLWKDGSALGYGRGDDPMKDEYNFTREVDFCSGASLMVRKNLYEKVGGMKSIYKPAYYEETDLCMEFIKAGYKIIYQPLSEITHFEYSSSSESKAIEYMCKNRLIFYERWKDLLINKPSNPTNINILKNRDRKPGKNILIKTLFPEKAINNNETIGINDKVTFIFNHYDEYLQALKFRKFETEIIYTTNITQFIKQREGYYDLYYLDYFNYFDLNKNIDIALNSKFRITI